MTAPPLATIGLMARLFPLRIRDEFARLETDELRRRWRKWDHVGTALFLALAPLCAIALHQLLVALAWARTMRASDVVYTLVASPIFWWFPAAVIGSILACVIVYLFYGIALQGRVREYRYYSNRSAGFNASGMFLAAGVIFGLGALALTYFAAQSHLLLGEDRIVMRRLWSTAEERFPYTAVTALKDIHDAKKDKTTFVIELADAPPWTTKVEIVIPEEVHKQFLALRSGKPIERSEAP